MQKKIFTRFIKNAKVAFILWEGEYMIQNIVNFGYTNNIYRNNKADKIQYSKPVLAKTLAHDTVCFTGMSQPSYYKTVFEYLSAEILSKNKKYQIDGSLLSANNIKTGVDRLFKLNKVYGPYIESLSDKIKWKDYIPQDIRQYSIDKINEARAARLHEWHTFLEAPEKFPQTNETEILKQYFHKDPSIKFLVWHSVNSELKNTNRHIPVPFDAKALLETLIGFEKIDPKDRAVRCASPSFLEIYTHRLRDNLLVEKGLSNNSEVWVKIPSIKNDPLNKAQNIHSLEILSNKNWCTRSSVDKAEAALEDGDFYIFLERDKNKLWQPQIGMTTLKGKIDQIQGGENNNIIPLGMLEKVKIFIKEKNLKCNSDIIPEGPKALQQILISEKLAQHSNELGKNFEKAIKENDSFAIFTFLNKQVDKMSDGSMIIDSYKPTCLLNAQSGISVPYSMLGINEDKLLSEVSKITGDFTLYHKNPLFMSSLKAFPPKLESVSGKVICSESQYEKFGEDIRRVVNNEMNRIIIRH